VATTGNTTQRLYIRVSRRNLSFTVYQPFGGMPPVVENYEVNPTASLNVNLKEALAQLPLAQEKYQRAEVMLNVPFTLKPVELFREEDAAAIYRKCFADVEYDRVLYDVAGSLGAVLVYGMSEMFCRVIDETYPSVRYLSSTTAMANRFADKARGSDRNQVFAYSHEDMLDMFVFSSGRLQLGNRYEIHGVDDAVYFVMLAVQILGLDVHRDEFHVLEYGNSEAGLAEKLKNFLADVRPGDALTEFGNSPVSNSPRLPYDMMAFLLQPF
jgi:hypothetical protein